MGKRVHTHKEGSARSGSKDHPSTGRRHSGKYREKKSYNEVITSVFKDVPFIKKLTQPLILFLVFVILYIILKMFVYWPTQNTVSYRDNNSNVLGLNIPSDLDFCGEKIPSNDYEIKEDLDKEFFSNSYWKHNSLILFHKAQRWFPYIEPILKQEGVPDDFKYLAVIESHLSNASSPAGAAGFWQLVPISARNYGLEVNDEVDERYNVEKATHAACGHIKDAYAIFNNWTLAAAAYNRGIGGIQNALANQKTDNYFDLMLNPETGSFIYRILAYKTLFSTPGHFGIKKKNWSYYPKIPFNTYKVDSAITDLGAFAKNVGTSIGTIKLFNPWLLKDYLNNPAKKVYEIKVPKKQDADYTGYLKDLLPEVGSLSEYAQNPVAVQTLEPDSFANLGNPVYHIVKVDEPLKDLATFLKVSEEDLRKWNNLNADVNAVKGQTLVIQYRSKE
jgi:membrane-bound lytic murein transglycosylase D